MPTGYLNNIRLSLPASTYAAGSGIGGLCAAASEGTRAPQAEAADTNIAAWNQSSPTLLESLDAQCQSFSGVYDPSTGPEALCSSSGISIDAARRSCARFAGLDANRPFLACLTDFCAVRTMTMSMYRPSNSRIGILRSLRQ